MHIKALFFGAFMVAVFIINAPMTHASQRPEESKQLKIKITEVHKKVNDYEKVELQIVQKEQPKKDNKPIISNGLLKNKAVTDSHLNSNIKEITKTNTTVVAKDIKVAITNIHINNPVQKVTNHTKTKQAIDIKKVDCIKTFIRKSGTVKPGSKNESGTKPSTVVVTTPIVKTEPIPKVPQPARNPVVLASTGESGTKKDSSAAPAIVAAEVQTPTTLPVTGGSSLGTIITIVAGILITLLGYVGSMAYQIAKL